MKYACGKCKRVVDQLDLVQREDCGLDVCSICSVRMDAEDQRAWYKSTQSRLQPRLNSIFVCPQCGSFKIIVQKPDFSFADMLWSLIILGPLVAIYLGIIGNNEVTVTCVQCSWQWSCKWKSSWEVFVNTLLLVIGTLAMSGIFCNIRS